MEELNPCITENSGLREGFNRIEELYNDTIRRLSAKCFALKLIETQLEDINTSIREIQTLQACNEEKFKVFLANDFEDLSTVHTMKNDMDVCLFLLFFFDYGFPTVLPISRLLHDFCTLLRGTIFEEVLKK